MNTARVLNERELAAELGLSPWTVRGMRLKEGCPYFTVGARIFYRLATVLAWIAAKEQDGRQQPAPAPKVGVLRRIVREAVLIEGYVRLHRRLLEGAIFSNPSLLKTWIWCLLKASHKEHKQTVGLKKITLMPGQFITGRFVGAAELKLNPSTFWKYMLWLRDNQSLDIQGNNKYSLVSLTNWELYQLAPLKNDSKGDIQNNIQRDSSVTQTKMEKWQNGKDTVPYGTVVETFNATCTSLPRVRDVTAHRQAAIKGFLKWIGQDGRTVEDFFRRVEASDFLTNRTEQGFRAGFDWVLKPANRQKIAEGNYDNRLPVSTQQRSRMAGAIAGTRAFLEEEI